MLKIVLGLKIQEQGIQQHVFVKDKILEENITYVSAIYIKTKNII